MEIISEREQIRLVKQSPDNIINIDNPADFVKNLAIMLDPNVIEYFEDQTEELCMLALRVSKSGFRVISNIRNPSHAVCEYIIRNMPGDFRYINKDSLTPDLILLALQINPYDIENVPVDMITQEMFDFCVREKKDAFLYAPERFWTDQIWLDYIDTLTIDDYENCTWTNARNFHVLSINFPNVMERLIEKIPVAIRDTENPLEEWCFTAIRNKPDTICCIRKPTAEMWELATILDPDLQKYSENPPLEFINSLRDNPSIIKDLKILTPTIVDIVMLADPLELLDHPMVKNFSMNTQSQYQCYSNRQKKDIIEYIVERNPLLVRYLPNKISDELKEKVVALNPLLISEFNAYSNDIAIPAVKQFPYVLGYIRQRSFEICKAAVTADPNVAVFIKDKAMRRQILMECQPRFKRTKAAV